MLPAPNRSADHRLDVDLARALRQAVDATDLLAVLRRQAGLTQETIATATGASLRSVRNWETGEVRLRRRSDDALRDLADVVAVLSATLTVRGIAQWLWARNRRLDGARPVDALGQARTDDVRAAALDLVEGRYE